MLSRFRQMIRTHRFALLLVALMAFLFVGPIYAAVRVAAPSFILRVLGVAFFNLMLISALFAISRSRKQLVISVSLSLPVLLFQGLSVVSDMKVVQICEPLVSTIFLGYVCAVIIASLFRARRVTGDMICASLCAYFFLAMFWASVYSLMEVVVPGSFSISDVHQGVSSALDVHGSEAGFAMYYSLVTLSTLGFGDVIPITPISRMLSVGEAVSGQIYLAVLVARLVGLHISQALMADAKESD